MTGIAGSCTLSFSCSTVGSILTVILLAWLVRDIRKMDRSSIEEGRCDKEDVPNEEFQR